MSLPDFYVRNGQKIFFFECKNSFLSSNIIDNNNLEDIIDDFKSKYYESKRGSKKAIKQLIGYIHSTLNNKFDFFDNIASSKKNKIKFYPIIITMDKRLETIGFDRLANEYFINDITDWDNKIKVNTKRTTIIHIDTFLKFNKSLKQLNKWIDDYHKYIANAKAMDSMISFDDYLYYKKNMRSKIPNKNIFNKLIKGSGLLAEE